jgi:hypothetical protein
MEVMPPFNPQRRRAAEPAEKLGSWQEDGTFKFDSPDAEQRWAVEAYRSGVHARDWHRGTPLDDKTRDVVLSGLGGPTAPVFRGPDGQYRFANINTIEPDDVRAVRQQSFRAAKPQDLTGPEMPGEDVIAARHAAKAGPVPSPANDNPPPASGTGRFAAMAQAQKDAAHPSLQETLQAIDDGVRLLANGATLGYADNLAAAGNALFGAGSFAEDYQKNLVQEQTQSAAARERTGKVGAVLEALPGMIPVYGDALALVGDTKQYIEHPETATIGNLLGTAATVLPWTPNVVGAARKVENTLEDAARAEAKVAGKAQEIPVQTLDPHETRFSQETVSYVKKRSTGENYTYDDILDSMKQNGWQGEPIDVVRMPDGKLTSADNTRVLAAREAGIPVQARVREFDNAISRRVAKRFKKTGPTPRTWGEAAVERIKQQSKTFVKANSFGSMEPPRITGRPKKYEE